MRPEDEIIKGLSRSYSHQSCPCEVAAAEEDSGKKTDPVGIVHSVFSRIQSLRSRLEASGFPIKHPDTYESLTHVNKLARWRSHYPWS